LLPFDFRLALSQRGVVNSTVKGVRHGSQVN
jgi:hypothetical protein